MSELEDNMDIAIVGLACRFPGARDAAAFWRNLTAGVESITPLTDEEIAQSGAPRAHLAAPNYVKAGAMLDEPGGFDAAFFGFTPGEARTMDPQHRILLELASAALDDAGCDPARTAGRIGVFAGAAMNTWFMHAGLSGKFAEDYIPTLIHNDKDFLSTRLSYKLNLKGPSLTIQTACSTSLAAVHLARQSLLSEETDLALAGAISVRVPHRAGYFADAGGVVSPDGHVRAFDAGANGTVFGSGGGVVVLKRLRDALADGDTIRAILKGSALNNDGAEKAGYTAPSVNSQADAVVEALANADVAAESISYVEAHGSGTPVGDPIEIRALTKAFRASTARSGFCALGSVKTNVGHLDAAAGMASLIKTILALQHRQIPPTLHFTRPNPEIDFPSTPFFVNTELRPWVSGDGGRLRAGIMSTGMGGTNAHVVLEEAPAPTPAPPSGRPNLFILSARTEPALAAAAEQLRAFLAEDPALNPDEVAATLQVGRRAFSQRRFVVAADRAGAITALAAKPARGTTARVEDGGRRPLVLLLPGVGDHYVGMGRELYAAFPVFRQGVDRCAGILRPLLGLDLRDLLYPPGRQWAPASASRGLDLKKMLAGNTQPPDDDDSRRLNQAVHLQPALFTIEYALARLWNDLGVTPRAFAGHSLGEYVAACLAGVFSLEDALRLIVRRTQLVDALPPARMLAVPLPEAELRTLLPAGLSIALINGPALSVIAGPPPEVESFAQSLTTRGVISRPVQNTHAFHSRLLDPIVPAFTAEVRKVRLHAPALPFLSNVTGRWITAAEATDPEYWGRHTNHTARFHDALQTLWQMENPVLLEAGPGRTLGVLAQGHPARPASIATLAIPSLRHHYESQPDEEVLLAGAGKLWLAGLELRWEHLQRGKSMRRIPLPTYPFERQNYWVEVAPDAPAEPPATPAIGKNPRAAEWYSVPSWKRLLPRTRALSGPLPPGRPWLVFLDGCGVAAALVERLQAAGQEVITVRAGRDWARLGAHDFSIAPGEAEHYGRLLESFPAPGGIVHAWSLSGDAAVSFEEAQELGYYSLMSLAGALARRSVGEECRLFVLSNHLQDVDGREALRPEKATVLGPCLVIPQEFPNLIAKSVDLELPLAARALEHLLGELIEPDAEVFVAHRHGQRWVQTYEPVALPAPGTVPTVFRQGGFYWITGGLGALGQEISRYLARTYRAQLLLTGRSPLPAREAWPAWLEAHPEDDPVSRKLRAIAGIEELGGSVLYGSAHVDDPRAMQTVLAEAERQFGPLHGVIHGAGVVANLGHGEIGVADREEGEAHFRSKPGGLLALESVLGGRALDFCLLMSTMAAILGGIGEAAYAAANICLDAYARRSARTGPLRWLSVNWDVWRLQDPPAGHAGPGGTLAELGITSAEAMEAMEAALTLGSGQLLISTGDLEARIRQWVKLESFRARPAALPASQSGAAASGDEMEEVIASVWRDVLGFETIGPEDSFLEMGGHSLLAMQILAKIRGLYQVELTLRDFFEAPTVAQLSALIRDKLILEIANLSDDEVRALIAHTSEQSA